MGEVTPQIRNNILEGVELEDGPIDSNHSLKLAVAVSTVGIKCGGERRVVIIECVVSLNHKA